MKTQLPHMPHIHPCRLGLLLLSQLQYTQNGLLYYAEMLTLADTLKQIQCTPYLTSMRCCICQVCLNA